MPPHKNHRLNQQWSRSLMPLPGLNELKQFNMQRVNCEEVNLTDITPMAYCKTVVSPMQMHWRYPSLALSHGLIPRQLLDTTRHSCSTHSRGLLQYRISLQTHNSVIQSFLNFAQSMAVILPCSVQNFKVIWQLKWMLWANETCV